MSIVALHDRRDEPAVRALIGEAPSSAAWRPVGWEVAGTLLACAWLSRTEDGDVELGSLVAAPDARGTGVERALVDALAEALNAQRLVAETDGEGAAFYRTCGFEVEPAGERDGLPRFRCTRSLDATPGATLAEPLGLAALEDAIRNAWSAETAEDPAAWSADNPAKDHCCVTALLIRELLGGEILIANVVKDGRRLERHAWNRLDSGVEVDLTRSQFRAGEQLATPRVEEPLMTGPRARAYELFASRVRRAISM
jgi:GNAT superfamily N-acetyltransferase